MFTVLSGAVLVVIGAVSFWYFLPRNGVVHPLAKTPFFDSMVTIIIMTFLVVGIGLMIEGLFFA
jgi:p-aminobenzoyl-glutamate transporter AbgT